MLTRQVGGILFSKGQKNGYLILPFLVLSSIAFLSACQVLVLSNAGGMGGTAVVETADTADTSSDEDNAGAVTGYGATSDSKKASPAKAGRS